MSPKLSKETEDIYILSAQDRSIVSTARDLLWKIVYASIARPHQLVGVAKALHVLSRLPQTTPKITVSVSLVGPRRWFGEHEIYHWWDVGITPHEISISAAGHFHTESSGGDTFTSMQWAAQPGAESDFSDYLLDLSIVDDAQPFESEINKLDLTAEAYSLEVTDESTDIAGDEGINDEEDDPETIVERDRAAAEQFADELQRKLGEAYEIEAYCGDW